MLGRTVLILVTIALLLGATACSSGGYDKGTNADVLLQVSSLSVPPVTAQQDPLNPAICTFTLTQSTVELENVPKTVGDMFSPANDILITRLTISYVWDDGVVTPVFMTSPRVTIPADSSGSLFFLAIPLDDLLNAAVPRDGHSAEMTIVFDGVTESNEGVQTIAGAALIVNECQ